MFTLSEQNNEDAVRCVDELRSNIERRFDGLENFELSNIWRSIEDLQNADADAKCGSKK
jgi:plasmid stabilization system protein ParE